MSVDFETKCEQHALEYIKIHLREGYFVNAYVDKGTYYWEKVYKIHAYKKSDAVSVSIAMQIQNSVVVSKTLHNFGEPMPTAATEKGESDD